MTAVDTWRHPHVDGLQINLAFIILVCIQVRFVSNFGKSKDKGSASAVAQPKQEEVLFTPVALSQVTVEELEELEELRLYMAKEKEPHW